LAIKKPASTRKSRVLLLLIIDNTIQKKYNKNNLKQEKDKISKHQPPRNLYKKILPAACPDDIHNIHQRAEKEHGQEIAGNNDGGHHHAVADIILPLQGGRYQEKYIAYERNPGKKKQEVVHGQES
jgi:hypothetical protein